MKRLKTVGCLTLYVMAIVAVVLIPSGLAAVSGMSTDVTDMIVFGQDNTLTCEWASVDGKEAIFTTEGGWRRFVDLSNQRTTAVVGAKYRLKHAMPTRWVQQTYLVRV